MNGDLQIVTDSAFAAENCISCGVCVKKCLMLQRYVKDPKKYFEGYLTSSSDKSNYISSYYCMVCGLCKTVCPKSIDLGQAFLSVRNDLVDKNGGTVPVKELNAVNTHQKLSFNSLFTSVSEGGKAK